MTRIIEDGLYACEDCALAIANGDYTGMDDATEARVRAGYRELFRRGYAMIGDDLGFTQEGCDCCGEPLAGNRHELLILFP